MLRKAAPVLLALVIGFVMYRAALATMPADQYGAASVPSCTGTVSPARFDGVTGLPVPSSCTAGDGKGASMLYASAEMYGHFQRSVLVGFAGAALALVVLWWSGRRRLSASQRRSAVLTSP